jgi:hypothetical protein
MSQGPNVGLVLLGIFIILFGLCITLVGGGCTVFMLSMVGQSQADGSEFAMFLILSLVVLTVGAGVLWLGIKVVRAGYKS